MPLLLFAAMMSQPELTHGETGQSGTQAVPALGTAALTPANYEVDEPPRNQERDPEHGDGGKPPASNDSKPPRSKGPGLSSEAWPYS
jgi:hypothetical protein